jgi:hypothetical protein
MKVPAPTATDDIMSGRFPLHRPFLVNLPRAKRLPGWAVHAQSGRSGYEPRAIRRLRMQFSRRFRDEGRWGSAQKFTAQGKGQVEVRCVHWYIIFILFASSDKGAAPITGVRVADGARWGCRSEKSRITKATKFGLASDGSPVPSPGVNRRKATERGDITGRHGMGWNCSATRSKPPRCAEGEIARKKQRTD